MNPFAQYAYLPNKPNKTKQPLSSTHPPPTSPKKRKREEHTAIEYGVDVKKITSITEVSSVQEGYVKLRSWRAGPGAVSSVDAFNNYLLRWGARLKDEPETAGFTSLVAVLLSVQCRDATVLQVPSLRLHIYMPHNSILPYWRQVMQDRFSMGITAQAALDLELPELEERVRKVNFYKTKASTIHKVAAQLLLRQGGRLPEDLPGLLALPGVGPKIAYLILTVVLGQSGAGIVVDSNLYRVAGRLGWATGKDAEAALFTSF